MDKEEIEMILEIITAICTIITLFVIYSTLTEMKTQRYKANEPCILPIQNKFNILNDVKMGEEKISLSISNNKIDFNEKDKPYFKIINAGLGIAKDISIEIKANFNYKEIFEILKQKFIENDSKIEITCDDTYCEVKIKNNNETIAYSTFPNNSKILVREDYLLPIKQNEEYLKLEIEHSVISIFSLLINLYDNFHFNDKQLFFMSLQKKIEFELTFNYKDNLNNKYNEKFVMQIEINNAELTEKGMCYIANCKRKNTIV